MSDDCGATGSVTVTFTATDDCGNASETTATFTIEDNEAPTFANIPQDVTLECDEPLPTAAPTATDVCGNATIVESEVVTPGSCPQENVIVRTWTATDDCGNASTATQTIFVIDSTEPVFSNVPAPVTIECDEALPTTQPDVADNCDTNVSVVETSDRIDGNCADNYTLVRTWTATDACGNTVTTQQNVTVQDTQSPVLSGIPADETVQCDNVPTAPAIGIDITAADNCDANPAITFAETETPGTCPQERVITRTWTVTDACGNSDVAIQVITVQDTEAPVFTFVPADATVECDQPIPNGTATADDNCDNIVDVSVVETEVVGNCAGNRVITFVWTATDDCGNSTQATTTITIIDTTAPTITTAPTNSTVECDGNGNQAAFDAWIANNGGGVATDNCGTVVWTTELLSESNDCGSTSTREIRFTATDDCGNATSANALFIIEDSRPPVIDVAATDMTIECAAFGNDQMLTDWLANNGGAVASDLCGSVGWSNNF